MTADLAIVAMATVTALQVVLDHRHRMKVADRERLVGPVKQAHIRPKGEPATSSGRDCERNELLLRSSAARAKARWQRDRMAGDVVLPHPGTPDAEQAEVASQADVQPLLQHGEGAAKR